jgi:hypothetical protein
MTSNLGGKMFLLRAAAVTAGLAFGSVGIGSAVADNSRFGGGVLRVLADQHITRVHHGAENRRILELDELFRQRLDASHRFKIIAIPPDLQKEVAAGPEIINCNGCERNFAKRIDADLAAWEACRK